jgi:hypothetical protein
MLLKMTLRLGGPDQRMVLTGASPEWFETAANEVKTELGLPDDWINLLSHLPGTATSLRGRNLFVDFRTRVNQVDEKIDQLEAALWEAYGDRREVWNWETRVNAEWSRDDSTRIGERLLDLMQLCTEISTDTAWVETANDAFELWKSLIDTAKFRVRWESIE